MNCKENDRAFLVSVEKGANSRKENIGGILKCVRLFHDEGGDVWECVAITKFKCDGGTFFPGELVDAYDRNLRPIDGDESPEESAEAMRLLTNIPSKVTV